MSVKREVAKKCRIQDLLSGRYVKREGWEPNYFDTEIGRISRANILGVIISAEDDNLFIDDGTGKIGLRNFEQGKPIRKSNVGDVVLVIGRPRSFNEQIFIVPEIIKEIENPKWIQHRLLELKNLKTHEKIIEEDKSEIESVVDNYNKENIAKILINKISEADKGNGAKIADLVKELNSAEANKAINQLIEQGEIFEIKPGILKVI